jgi:tetratricopeptide (TPR) repeat protein
MKNGYKNFEQWKLAVEACQHASAMRPEDMDLLKELKDLGAQHTLSHGRYGTAKSFRDSMRDMEGQQSLMENERDFKSDDFLSRKAKEAEVDWGNSPDDLTLFSKYVDALRATESPEYENKAIEQLDLMHQKTRQFKWRQKLGEIKMAQLSRLERVMRADMQRDPDMKKEYIQFIREKAQLEMAEYQLIVENYPTDTTARFQIAQRMFQLGQFHEAIPVFQQVRNDPKYRIPASLLLGRAFLESGFAEESVETLKAVLDEYPAKGDDRSKEMYYWYGRSLENHKDHAGAIRQYSQVAQVDFNYRDVQERIKRLRAAPGQK